MYIYCFVRSLVFNTAYIITNVPVLTISTIFTPKGNGCFLIWFSCEGHNTHSYNWQPAHLPDLRYWSIAILSSYTARGILLHNWPINGAYNNIFAMAGLTSEYKVLKWFYNSSQSRRHFGRVIVRSIGL